MPRSSAYAKKHSERLLVKPTCLSKHLDFPSTLSTVPDLRSITRSAGYRTQGLTLVRAAFEDYGTAGWVTMQPDDANLWLWEIVDDVPKPDQRPPRFTEIFKRLSEENLDSPDVLKDLYGRLSEAAHPRAPGLQWNAQFGGGDEGAKYSAEFLPVWDNSATATCLHYLLLIAHLILAAAVELRISSLPDDADDTQPLLAESQRVSALILEALGRIRPFVPTADAPDST